MSKRQGQSAPTVSLFPFLAVLVCAMGSLILLLLIITRNVRPQITPTATIMEENVVADKSTTVEQALPEEVSVSLPELEEQSPAVKTEVAAAQPPAIPEPVQITGLIGNSEPAPALERNDPSARFFDSARDGDHARFSNLHRQQQAHTELKQRLQQLQADFARAQQLLQDKQTVQEQLQKQLQTLEAENQQQQQSGQKQASLLQEQKQSVQRLQTELQALDQQLAELKERETERQDKLEIVTYNGPTGVKRQPIFIECTAGEVIFHPEQVSISLRDLEDFPAEYSPLAYAVRALAEHRAEKTQQTLQPYVLMVGRPNGIKEFYGSGQLLGMNQIAFGYELVAQNQELYFGPPDPEARKVILEALEKARQQAPVPPQSRFARMNARAEEMKRVPRPMTGTAEPTSRRGQSTGVDVPKLPMPEPASRGTSARQPQRPPAGQFPPADPSTDRLSSLFPESAPFSAPGGGGSNQSVEQQPSGEAENWRSAQKTAAEVATSQSRPSPGNSTSPATTAQANRASSGGSSSGRAGKAAGNNSASGKIKIEQKVVVKVYSDGLQVGKQKFVPLNPAMNTEEVEQIFLSLLQNEMLGWDDPPEGIEWTPALQLQIATGGNLHAFRIEELATELEMKRTTIYIISRSPQQGPMFFE